MSLLFHIFSVEKKMWYLFFSGTVLFYLICGYSAPYIFLAFGMISSWLNNTLLCIYTIFSLSTHLMANSMCQKSILISIKTWIPIKMIQSINRHTNITVIFHHPEGPSSWKITLGGEWYERVKFRSVLKSLDGGIMCIILKQHWYIFYY